MAMSPTATSTDSSGSILHRRHDDCLPCRLVSGCGVIGMGAYVYSQGKHRPAGLGRNAVYAVAAVAVAVGASRLIGTFPFNKDKSIVK